MTIMTVIYILVGIIALCGVIGGYLFVITKILGTENTPSDLDYDQKHIDFINNYEYCPKEDK